MARTQRRAKHRRARIYPDDGSVLNQLTNRPLRILVLSASTGNGHHSAANALVAEFQSRGWTSEMVDVMDHVPKAFRAWFKGGYEMLVKKSPKYWGHLYRSSDRPLGNYWFQTALDHRFTHQLDQLIRNYKPDWIICTHSIIQPRLPQLQKQLGFKIGIVITDLHPHRMWMRGKADRYFVPTSETAKRLAKRLPYTKSITDVVGIPVHKAFTTSQAVERGTYALLNSGGIGAGPFAETIEILREAGHPVKVVTGKSVATQERLTRLFADDPNVEVFGHVTPDQMAGLMRSCRFMIGKSGGLTTFEALSTGAPFFVLKPFVIPGQEEDNAKWLEQIGAGIHIRSLTELTSVVKDTGHDQSKLDDMTHNALRFAVPDSAQRVANRIAGESR